MKHDDLTIVLQGPADSSGKIGRGILNIPSYKEFTDNIIISTWINPKVKPSRRFLERNEITYIEDDPEKYSDFFDWSNIHYQTATSLNGIKIVTTKYVIKSRTDEYYSDLSHFISVMKQNQNSLVTSEPFYRDTRSPRDISDHLMGGKTSKMQDMFGKVYEKCKANKVEQSSYAPEDFYRDNFDGPNVIVKMDKFGQFWSKVGNRKITRREYEGFSDGRRRVRG